MPIWQVMYGVGRDNSYFTSQHKMAAAMPIALSLKLPTRASLGWLHASKFTESKTHAATPDNLLPPWHVSCCITLLGLCRRGGSRKYILT